MTSAIVLLSGGVESATVLYLLEPTRTVALCIDYGQRAAQRERRAAEALCAARGVPLRVFDLAQVGEAFRAEQTQRLHVPIPHRNLLALTLGLCYAEQAQASELHLGLNEEDTRAYPSAAPAFLERFGQLAGTLGAVRLSLPLLDHSKSAIIARGRALGVDYALTYSCLLGGERHCGRCPQCEKRRQAFQAAGAPEPAGFYRSPASG